MFKQFIWVLYKTKGGWLIFVHELKKKKKVLTYNNMAMNVWKLCFLQTNYSMYGQWCTHGYVCTSFFASGSRASTDQLMTSGGLFFLLNLGSLLLWLLVWYQYVRLQQHVIIITLHFLFPPSAFTAELVLLCLKAAWRDGREVDIRSWK